MEDGLKLGCAEGHRLADFKVRPENATVQEKSPLQKEASLDPCFPNPQLSFPLSFPFPFFLFSFLSALLLSFLPFFYPSTHPPSSLYGEKSGIPHQCSAGKLPAANPRLTTYWPWPLPQKGLDLWILSCSRDGNSLYPTRSLRGFKSAKPALSMLLNASSVLSTCSYCAIYSYLFIHLFSLQTK